jgi:chromosome segregation ATPase
MGKELERAATELKRKIVGGKEDTPADTNQEPVADASQDEASVNQLEELETGLEGVGAETAPSGELPRDQINPDEIAEQDGIPEDGSVSESVASGSASRNPGLVESQSSADVADDDLEQKMQSLRESVETDQLPTDAEGKPLSEKVDEALEKAEENRKRMKEIPSGSVQNEIEDLREENRQLEAEVEQTRELLGEVENENESLASEVEELADQSQETTVRIQEGDTDFEEVESHLESVDDRLEEVSHEVSEHDREIDSLHEKRKELAEKLESLALRVESNEHGQGRLAEKLESFSKELDRYERRLHEDNAPSHMVEEKDRMRGILDTASEAVDGETSRTSEPEQQEVEEELSVFQGSNKAVTEQDFRELFEIVEENSQRIEELSQEMEESSADQDLSAVNQEVAGLRGRTQQNEREIQRILDTVEELSEILKMELRSDGL